MHDHDIRHGASASAVRVMPDFVFPRPEESAALRDRLARRATLLIHGPAGVGKTFLVRNILPDFPSFLYCSDAATIAAVLRSVAQQLCRAGIPRLQRACHGDVAALARKSVVSLKGLALEALRDGQFCLVLDHLSRPAASFGAVFREIIGWASTPVVAIARSAHMEDIGSLHGLFPDRNDRFEVRNLPPGPATALAKAAAEHQRLAAENLPEFLCRLVEFSRGNPGAILRLLNMANQERYRRENNIKINSLYIDFRLAAGS